MKSYDEFKEELLQRKEHRAAIRRNRKARIITGFVCLALCIALLVASLPGGKPIIPTVQAADLMAGITPSAVTGREADDAFRTSQMAFALKLFQSCYANDPQKSTLVSPLSVMLALSMTANGASGQTKAEMEAVLGMPIHELNRYLYSYVNQLPASDKNKVTIANSVWYRNNEHLQINPTFLQSVADYYGAGAYKAPFDTGTVNDINQWVSENTDGLIDKILEQIDPGVVMYLINTLLLDLQWWQPYSDEDLWKGKFTGTDGKKKAVTMMRNIQTCPYFYDDNAVGFMKYYDKGHYAFVAILPNEGISVEDYVNSLTVESLNLLLSSQERISVNSLTPKFSYDYGINLNRILANMGMPSAFGSSADFSNMTNLDLAVGEVLHQTHITLDQAGTRAGAATIVSAELGGKAPYDVFINLNRPFVYMIIDTVNDLPLFMGTVMSIDN